MKILSNLRLWQKLSLFGVLGIALLAGPLTLYMNLSNRDIDAADREKVGIPYVKELLEVVKLTQQHRALSAAVLGGTTALDGDRKAKQAEVERALDSYSAVLKGGIPDQRMSSSWQQSLDHWKTLVQDVGGRAMPAKASNASHTRLVARHLAQLDATVDHFGITLDPEPASYHLIIASLSHLPHLSESMGQMRAAGSAALATHAVTSDERGALIALSGRVEQYAGSVSHELEKAFAADATLKTALEGPSRQATELMKNATRVVREQVTHAAELNSDVKQYISITTEAINAQLALGGAAMTELDRLVIARSEALHRGQWIVMGAIALVMLLALALGIAITRSITVPMKEAQRAAMALAAGDLSVTVEQRTKDEVGELMGALEKTVGGLTKLVTGIQSSSGAITTATQQIAAGNADLSQRTEEQASSLEETASSMEELTSAVKQNAENAKQANQLAASASEVAVRGGKVVGQVVGTMSSINDSSKKIVDIISVI
ncbi:MAG: HAMP domain-containing protein, partial [Pseudomonadota bacterium]